MQYAALIEVDNSRENPDDGRRGLRDELLPVLRALPGHDSSLLLTSYDLGRGVAVVVFDDDASAHALCGGVVVGQTLRPGVVVTRVEVLEVTARSER